MRRAGQEALNECKIPFRFQTTNRSVSGMLMVPRHAFAEIPPMRLSVLSRKVHYWGSLFVVPPILIVIVTGILLQLRKQIPWVQPPEQRGQSKTPALSFAQILEKCRERPETGIQTWEDINRLDVRPGRGITKVWAKSDWEIQLDTQTGDILQVAYRRSDWIESIHEGSWFGESVKWLIFFPAALVLLILWLSGLYLFWMPLIVKWRRRKAAATIAAASPKA
jgi:uncharacterized iron-regulated membrane protein